MFHSCTSTYTGDNCSSPIQLDAYWYCEPQGESGQQLETGGRVCCQTPSHIFRSPPPPVSSVNACDIWKHLLLLSCFLIPCLSFKITIRKEFSEGILNNIKKWGDLGGLCSQKQLASWEIICLRYFTLLENARKRGNLTFASAMYPDILWICPPKCIQIP